MIMKWDDLPSPALLRKNQGVPESFPRKFVFKEDVGNNFVMVADALQGHNGGAGC